MDYGTLYALMQRVVSALQRDGITPQSTIAICAQTSLNYTVVLLGAVMAGVIVVPLVSTSTSSTLATMVADAEAKLLFVDSAARQALASESISATKVDLESLRAGSGDRGSPPKGRRRGPLR